MARSRRALLLAVLLGALMAGGACSLGMERQLGAAHANSAASLDALRMELASGQRSAARALRTPEAASWRHASRLRQGAVSRKLRSPARPPAHRSPSPTARPPA